MGLGRGALTVDKTWMAGCTSQSAVTTHGRRQLQRSLGRGSAVFPAALVCSLLVLEGGGGGRGAQHRKAFVNLGRSAFPRVGCRQPFSQLPTSNQLDYVLSETRRLRTATGGADAVAMAAVAPARP